MRKALISGIGLALTAIAPSAAQAFGCWDWDCRRERYVPVPVYVYDPRMGPVWTPNGYAYPAVYYVPPPMPVPVYYPAPYPIPQPRIYKPRRHVHTRDCRCNDGLK